MRMAMVEVGDMWVIMRERRVMVGMPVHRTRRITGVVHMLMMRVVFMGVVMVQFLMAVQVGMDLGDMQPETRTHQDASGD